MIVRWLGRVKFEDALALQEEIVARKIAERESDDELLLLEHEPVYTIGRNPDQSSLRGAAHLPHRVVQILQPRRQKTPRILQAPKAADAEQPRRDGRHAELARERLGGTLVARDGLPDTVSFH